MKVIDRFSRSVVFVILELPLVKRCARSSVVFENSTKRIIRSLTPIDVHKINRVKVKLGVGF